MGMSHVMLWPVLLEWRANRKTTHAIKAVGVIYLPPVIILLRAVRLPHASSLFYPRGILGAADNLSGASSVSMVMVLGPPALRARAFGSRRV